MFPELSRTLESARVPSSWSWLRLFCWCYRETQLNNIIFREVRCNSDTCCKNSDFHNSLSQCKSARYQFWSAAQHHSAAHTAVLQYPGEGILGRVLQAGQGDTNLCRLSHGHCLLPDRECKSPPHGQLLRKYQPAPTQAGTVAIPPTSCISAVISATLCCHPPHLVHWQPHSRP